ncbi:hypothetical protein KR222_007115, partial [Zaprionus bogoriensis]
AIAIAVQLGIMENALFSNVTKLYDHGLYECVIPVANMLFTVMKNDSNVATLEMEYQTLLYLSSANYKEQNYTTASKQLESVVEQRKTMLRYKSSRLSSLEASYTHFQESEIYYRIAVCYRESGKYASAISTLQAVKNRTPRLNMLLARLLHHHGRGIPKSEPAVAYKDVLRECPMSLTSIEALIELGVEGSEVHSMVVNAATMPSNIEWLSGWIKGHAQMYGCKHLEAAKTFQQLNDNTKLRQNEHLLSNIGRCLYYYGSYPQAERYLEMVRRVNPRNMDTLSALAVVYEFNRKSRTEQERLKSALPVAECREFKSAHWFLYAQLTYMASKYERALVFTERALHMDPRNVEAVLLRGKLLGGLGRHKEAIEEFRTVQRLAPYRFEVYKGMLNCYIRQKRIKEAHNLCVLAVRYFPTAPRSHTMFAGTLFHSPNAEAKRQAKRFVEKALQLDEHYAPAIALMASTLQFEGSLPEAIALLRKQVEYYPHPKLCAMLAEMLRDEKDLNGALHFYTLALR